MNPAEFHCTAPLLYKSFHYWIAGLPGQYRFTVQTLEGGRVFTSDRYPTIVTANHEARKRIDLANAANAAMGVRHESA